MSNSIHAFNLNPLRFEKFWNADNQHALLLHSLIDPANALRKKLLSADLKKRILDLVVGEENSRGLYANFAQENMDVVRFRHEVLTVLHKDFHEPFDKVLNRALTELSFEDFISKLPQITVGLGFKLSPKQVLDISQLFKEKIKRKERLSTFSLAHLLHEALVKICSLYFPHHILEEKICSHFHLPQIVEIGNLNWAVELCENVCISRLIMKFNLAKNRLELLERRQGVDMPLSDNFFEELKTGTFLHFESYSSISK
ncbi:MAG: hypothetical protein JJU12_02080 [Chlamydiales bacterium]|nr:hypothetical protein [Chlamydiales bacterium]